ncbi:hypothetical protein GCM10022251_75250 [Phytohabitans flavus]|uniref:Uncharacterized protein n=1 Tax=Phytohabitans flavus TaxID=1076124 RepID=A0A6F8XLD2_9ACTN|nr:hypothetical protein [Phytohabitans flavus]BCB74617.1 hypothetical protein Pflav_010270 [Phytohabitans flavus]
MKLKLAVVAGLATLAALLVAPAPAQTASTLACSAAGSYSQILNGTRLHVLARRHPRYRWRGGDDAGLMTDERCSRDVVADRILQGMDRISPRRRVNRDHENICVPIRT